MSYRIPLKIINSVLTYVFDKVSSFTLNVIISGFTQLGDSAPKIKMKKVTGTTASAEGNTTVVAHGVNGNKIISYTTSIKLDSNNWINDHYTETVGLQVGVYYQTDNFIVLNHATNSENVLSKPFVITIFYEE